MAKINCDICGSQIKTDQYGWDKGHNAQPVVDGRCCTNCNNTKVIPARLLQITTGVVKNENKG
mgnify:CR=1 FL=1